MIKAIIIDDEQHCTDRLTSLLGEYGRGRVQLIQCYHNAENGLKGIREHRPELIFLDVMLGEQTGFDLLKALPNVDFDIIFTTAFDTFAVQAFRFSALDYLLKPIDPDDLVQAIGKVERKLHRDQIPARLEALFQHIDGSRLKRIAIPTVTGLRFIDVQDIIRCQAEVNYTILFLKDRQKITVARTLKEFEELLGDYQFFRVHNSHLINLNYVKTYHRGKGGTVTMTDEAAIEVASRRKDEFLKKMMG